MPLYSQPSCEAIVGAADCAIAVSTSMLGCPPTQQQRDAITLKQTYSAGN
jgi:hypothetical protein